MKKYLLTTLVATLLAPTLHGEGDTPFVDKLKLYSHGGGEPVNVALHEIRRISFEDGNMTILLHNEKSVSNPLTSVAKIVFETKNNVGIESILDQKDLRIASSDQGVAILGLPEEQGFPLLVFGLDGGLVHQTSYYRNGEWISTAGLASGVYLIRINNRTLKFKKL